MMPLHGKTALITGSTDGVGRVVAERLGEAGARVLIHGRDRQRGERVVATIKAAGGRRNSWLRISHRWLKCADLRRPLARARQGWTCLSTMRALARRARRG